MAGIRSATYLYDANGTKLKSVQTADGVTTTREYISGIQYTNGAIDFIQTDEGMAVRNAGDGTYKYQYNLKDHLGNTRVSIDDNGSGTAEVTQEDEYYAFGLDVPKFRLTTENKYLYNGKEKQDVLTDELDYGARFYDPVIGRWTSVDPLAEKGRRWSPYAYGFDNSMKFIDPDGRWPDWKELLEGVSQTAFGGTAAVVGTTAAVVGSPTIVATAAGAAAATLGVSTAGFGIAKIVDSFRADDKKQMDIPSTTQGGIVKGISKRMGANDAQANFYSGATDLWVGGKPSNVKETFEAGATMIDMMGEHSAHLDNSKMKRDHTKTTVEPPKPVLKPKEKDKDKPKPQTTIQAATYGY